MVRNKSVRYRYCINEFTRTNIKSKILDFPVGLKHSLTCGFTKEERFGLDQLTPRKLKSLSMIKIIIYFFTQNNTDNAAL